MNPSDNETTIPQELREADRPTNRKKTNHILHLLLSIVTSGLWILIAISNGAYNSICLILIAIGSVACNSLCLKEPNPNLRIFLVCSLILVLDQAGKLLVQHFLPFQGEWIVIDGFFRFVHWGNTGAAFSFFQDSNTALAVVGILAAFMLYMNRTLFGAHHFLGQIALGLMLGGIIGNLIDRLRVQHVIDFLYFYTYQRGGGEWGFPAFNVADTAICTGVGLLLLLSWRKESSNAEENVVSEPSALQTAASELPKPK